MPPAARLKDEHTCPLVDVLKPHVGGPIEKSQIDNRCNHWCVNTWNWLCQYWTIVMILKRILLNM
jgi:hypothetical protein